MSDIRLDPRQHALLCDLTAPEGPGSSKPERITASRTAQTTG